MENRGKLARDAGITADRPPALAQGQANVEPAITPDQREVLIQRIREQRARALEQRVQEQRRPDRRPAQTSEGEYGKTGVLLALYVALFVLGSVYLINMASTTWGLQLPLRWVGFSVNRMIGFLGVAPITAPDGVFWGVGIVMHISISALSLHLWRARNRILTYGFGLPANFIDVGTASVACSYFFAGGFQPDIWLNVVFAVLGVAIAIPSEPLLALTWGIIQEESSK